MGSGMTWIEVSHSAENETTFVLYNKATMKAQNQSISVEHPNVMLSTQDIESAYAKSKDNCVVVGELMKMPYSSMFSFEDQDRNNYIL